METLHGYDAIKGAIQKPTITLILAKTRTCSVCAVAESRLMKGVTKLPDIDAYRVYLEDDERFRGEALVFSVPTVILYAEGRELLRESRFIDIDKINRLIERFTE